MKIDITKFFGTMPSASPLSLPEGFAQVALDCDLRGGMLSPLKSYRSVGSLGTSGVKSLHKFGYQSTDEMQWWLAFNADVDVAKGPVFNDVEERTYLTGNWPVGGGNTKMKKTRLGLANSGGAPYPNAWLNAGLPAPANLPIVTASGGVTDVEPEVRLYVETFVTSWDEESEPGTPSARVTVNSGGTVVVSNLSPAPSGSYAVNRRRLYRLNYTGTTESDLQLVVELPIGTTSYSDTKAKIDLGGTLKTQDFDAPPDGISGLTAMPNNMLAGFLGFDVYFGEMGHPYAWPVKYCQTVDSPVVGLGSFGQTLVALTKGSPFVGSGVDPEQMVLSRAEVPETHAGCLSKRGIVSVPGGIYYPTKYGIAMIGPGKAELVTEKFVNNLQWGASFGPATMVGAAAGSRLIWFYDTGAKQRGMILDPEVPGLVETTVYATAAHRSNGQLYLAMGSSLVAWEDGSTYLNYTWKSRRFSLPKTCNMSVGRVIADAYPVTLKLYGDGVLRATRTVANSREFTLPGGYMARDWEIQMEGSNRVRRVAVAETSEELRDILS